MHLCISNILAFLVTSTSIGTPIDKADGRGFRVTRRGRMGGNLATDKGGGWAEAVLGSVEGVECDTN